MNVNLKHYVKLTIKRRIVMQLEGRDKRQQNVGSSWRRRFMQNVCAWTARDKKRRIVESPWRFRSLKSFCHRYIIMFTFILKLTVLTPMTIWRYAGRAWGWAGIADDDLTTIRDYIHN